MRCLHILTICVVISVAAGAQKESTRRRSSRRRRSEDSSANDGVFKKVLEELVAITKELRTAKEEIKDLKALQTETAKKLAHMEENASPFEVLPEQKTVKLSGWNFVVAGDGQEGVGNLIVGNNTHNVTKATDSFFTGKGHTAVGEGNVFLGGLLNTAIGRHNVLASGRLNKAGVKKGEEDDGCIGNSAKCQECQECLVGGDENRAISYRSTVLGGYGNLIEEAQGSIFGSQGSKVQSYGSTILGGMGNTIESSSHGTIVGGHVNKLENGATFSVIVGGNGNQQRNGAYAAAIVGGQWNVIERGASYSVIAGGQFNELKWSPTTSSIFGGVKNVIGWGGTGNSVMGGFNNTISGPIYSAITGGWNNTVFAGTAGSILGGENNTIGGHLAIRGAIIAGGLQNTVSSHYGSITGGEDNVIHTGTFGGAITGGRSNSMQPGQLGIPLGDYVPLWKVKVTLGPSRLSKHITTLDKGHQVKVVEIKEVPEEKRIRARIADTLFNTAGWITMYNTASRYFYLKTASGLYASDPAFYPTMTGGSMNLIRGGMFGSIAAGENNTIHKTNFSTIFNGRHKMAEHSWSLILGRFGKEDPSSSAITPHSYAPKADGEESKSLDDVVHSVEKHCSRHENDAIELRASLEKSKRRVQHEIAAAERRSEGLADDPMDDTLDSPEASLDDSSYMPFS